MDQYPFRLEMFLLLEDYLELIETLKSNEKLKSYAEHCQILLDKQLEDF